MRKKAVITGASRGIGRAIACAFAEAGYDLTLCCRRQTALLHTLQKELGAKYGARCSVRTGNVSDASFVETLFENLETLDVLVNNAGVSHVGLLSEMSVEEWNEVLSTNLTSAFLCCRQAIPVMLRRHSGKIINISSVWGNTGASMEVAYSASKAGLNGFTKALAKELAPSNIQVNAISPGFIDTEMNLCFSDEEVLSIIEEIPANRIGRPEEVAGLAVQLAAGNEYLTGQIITLDGGWT